MSEQLHDDMLVDDHCEICGESEPDCICDEDDPRDDNTMPCQCPYCMCTDDTEYGVCDSCRAGAHHG